MGQPGASQAGQPAAQPATGYPAQPGAGQPGATSSISIKGILIAAAAIVAVVIAALAALLLLRPNPPQQTAAQQSPTTAANLPPGAVAPPGAAPAGATPDGPWFRGTYNYRGTSGGATSTVVGTITSNCPRCDAKQDDGEVWQWNGTGWQKTQSIACGSSTFTLTPTVVVNGIAQELSGHGLTPCGGREVQYTFTRVGD
jgi:hypothetical protein